MSKRPLRLPPRHGKEGIDFGTQNGELTPVQGLPFIVGVNDCQPPKKCSGLRNQDWDGEGDELRLGTCHLFIDPSLIK